MKCFKCDHEGYKAKDCKRGDGENSNVGEETSVESNPAEGTAETPGQGVGQAENMAKDLGAEGVNSNDNEPPGTQEDREVVRETTGIAWAEAGEPASKKISATVGVGYKAKDCKRGDGENSNVGEETSVESNPAEGTAETPGQGVGQAENMAEDLGAEGVNSNDNEPPGTQEDREVVRETTGIAWAEAGEPASKKISATVGVGEQAELGAQVEVLVEVEVKVEVLVEVEVKVEVLVEVEVKVEVLVEVEVKVEVLVEVEVKVEVLVEVEVKVEVLVEVKVEVKVKVEVEVKVEVLVEVEVKVEVEVEVEGEGTLVIIIFNGANSTVHYVSSNARQGVRYS
ncbi:UNVERIFIED_CONTAM: hypothetical protein FKN15_036409 [Acipenser sinensis]